MGGFKAEPKVISTFGEELDGLVTEAKAACTYAEDYLAVSGAEAGSFQTVVGVLSDAKAALVDNYERPEAPGLDIAHGDVALSKHLKNSLEVLKDKVEDPEFKRLVDDITAGRRSLRDMIDTPALARALDPLVEQGAETYRNLSEEEREYLARQGDDQFEQLREEIANPTESEHSDDDGDDEDFSYRSWTR